MVGIFNYPNLFLVKNFIFFVDRAEAFRHKATPTAMVVRKCCARIWATDLLLHDTVNKRLSAGGCGGLFHTYIPAFTCNNKDDLRVINSNVRKAIANDHKSYMASIGWCVCVSLFNFGSSFR